MGEVKTKIKLTNFGDMKMAERSFIPYDEIRSLELEMIVDTGATLIILGAETANQLGIEKASSITIQLADDSFQKHHKGHGLFVEFKGRNCLTDCIILEEGVTPLLGQIPLEEMDLVVDCKNQKLIPNPESRCGNIPLLKAK